MFHFMKYIKQFCIIILISLAGEILNYIIPLPIPASIYGLLIMLTCLCTGVISPESVRDCAHFLIEIMPLMFISPAVGLIASWDSIRPKVVCYIVMTAVSTIAVMAVSGRVTQAVLHHGKRSGDK